MRGSNMTPEEHSWRGSLGYMSRLIRRGLIGDIEKVNIFTAKGFQEKDAGSRISDRGSLKQKVK
jgi:hypothetical protein